MKSKSSLGPTPSSAFTLMELLVVIAIIAILAGLILVALSRGKQKAQGVYCLNNGKQMMHAIQIYADEHDGLLPPNPDDGNTVPGHNWCSGRAGKGQAEEFNPDVMKDPSFNLLLPYLSGDIRLFRCPGDTRTGLYTGTNSSLQGKTVPSIRTFSMNQAVGTICPGYDEYTKTGMGKQHAGEPKLPVNGPWLNNERTHRRGERWATYGTIDSFANPSGIWVLMDESLENLNDAAFSIGMERPTWLDLPGTYHNNGGGFAFADGHTESHQWKYSGKRETRHGGTIPITDPLDQQDYNWIRARTSEMLVGKE